MKNDLRVKRTGKIRAWLEGRMNIEFQKVLPRAFERKGVNLELKGKKNLVGMEIGVYEARHAKALLKYLDISSLCLIDPYEEYGLSKLKDSSEEKINNMKRRAVRYLYKYSNLIQWNFSRSVDISNHFTDDSFDFIYLDGDHTYETVSKEIELYYPKVKKGGVFGGHDFGECKINPQKNGVLRAVLKFIQEKKLRLYHYGTDWWVVK